MIAALEERYPEPPLYPADPEQRRRALELEDFFDEELGPHMRLLAFHELRNDPERFATLMEADRSRPAREGRPARSPSTRAPTPTCASASPTPRTRRWRGPRSSPPSTASKRSSAASEYLVGDSFSVADLTAASLFYPLVLPDEGPVPNDEPTPPAGLEDFRAPLGRPRRLHVGRRDVPPAPQAGRPPRQPPDHLAPLRSIS